MLRHGLLAAVVGHALGVALLPRESNAQLLQTAAAAANRAPPANSTSCAVLGCNYYEKGAPCTCNWACLHYSDCCTDFAAVCGNGTHPHPAPAPPPAGPKAGPEQLHVSMTNDSPRRYVVSFATASTYTTPPACSAGNASHAYTHRFTGSTHTYTAGNWLGLLHTVVLDVAALGGAVNNVAAAAASSSPPRVYYSCDGGATEYSFPVVPPSQLPLTLAVVADLGEDCNRPGCGNSTITALTREVDAGNISLLVHAGDIAYTSGVQTVWDEFLREMEPATARVPYMVCVGNHEHWFNFSGYLNRFAMPGPLVSAAEAVAVEAMVVPPHVGPGGGSPVPLSVNNLWHSYDHGGVHFVAFSSEHNLTTQLPFLEADLAAAAANRAAVPWIVVYGHRPVYCSTNDYYDCEVKGPKELGPALEPLMRRFGVDLYLAGHLHNYERSFPVYNGTRVSTSYERPDAPVHVVVGMAGNEEGLTYTWTSPQPQWSAKRMTALGYAKLYFRNASVLDFEYLYSANGSVADAFTLTRAAE